MYIGWCIKSILCTCIEVPFIQSVLYQRFHYTVHVQLQNVHVHIQCTKLLCMAYVIVTALDWCSYLVQGYGFCPVYQGDGLSYTCRGLQRVTVYSFRLTATNSAGTSPTSPPVSFTTLPESPGSHTAQPHMYMYIPE